MASTGFHESVEALSEEAREMHRALASLIEELEAVDWYGQRIEASGDEDLRRILAHNRDEEKEHACMALEWIRRRDRGFDRFLRRYLFRAGEIHEEEEDEGKAEDARAAEGGRPDPTLGIGSLRAPTWEDRSCST